MRTAAKRDSNDSEHVAEWELLGALPVPVSQKGMPDHAVLHDGRTYWAETKGAKGGLTAAQVATFTRMHAMGVPVYVVRTRADARHMLDGRLSPWHPNQGRMAGADVKKRAHRPGVDRARTLAEMCRMTGCARSVMPGTHWCLKHQD